VEKTLAELSGTFGVHPTMIGGWKQGSADELLARGNKAPAIESALTVPEIVNRQRVGD
jgi:hypothetical protein